MPDINELFDSFPDYDVLEESDGQNGRRRPKRRKSNPAPPERPAEDYGDGYGVFVETKSKNRNFITIFFFPIVILWLEFSLRFSIGEPLSFASVLYTVFFSMVTAALLTVICTFGSPAFNKVLCNIFMIMLTALYVFQTVFHAATGEFLTFTSGAMPAAELLTNALMDKLVFVFAELLPLVFSLTVGLFAVPFKRIRVAAKISLVLVAVLCFLVASTAITLNKDSKSPISSFKVYHSATQIEEKQERFGLITMERLDLTNLILGNK